MQFHDYLHSAWRRLPLILLIAVAVVLVGLRGGSGETRYTSHVQLHFSLGPESVQPEIVEYSSTQLRSLTEIVDSPDVLQPVIDDLALDTTVASLGKRIGATLEPGTFIVTVSANATTTEADAVQLVEGVAASLISNGADLTSPQLVQVAELSPQTVVSTPASSPSPKGVVKDLIVGLVLGVALNVILDIVNPRVRSRGELSRLTSVPVLESGPKSSDAPYASAAARLVLAAPERDRRVVVVIPTGTLDRSSVSSAQHLSRALSDISHSVALVSPSKPTTDERMTSLSLDTTFPQHQPGALQERLNELTELYDTVVILVPAVDVSSSSLLIARLADLSVVLVEEHRDTRAAALGNLNVLKDAGVTSLAALLVPSRRFFERRQR